MNGLALIVLFFRRNLLDGGLRFPRFHLPVQDLHQRLFCHRGSVFFLQRFHQRLTGFRFGQFGRTFQLDLRIFGQNQLP